jgi:hypothetical protein
MIHLKIHPAAAALETECWDSFRDFRFLVFDLRLPAAGGHLSSQSKIKNQKSGISATACQ